MKASELINRITEIVTTHRRGCTGTAKANCVALAELAELIYENPVKLRPRSRCRQPHFTSPSAVHRIDFDCGCKISVDCETSYGGVTYCGKHGDRPKPPTWINSDGEEVLIESMTDAHLENTIRFIERWRTERGLAAFELLKRERLKRLGLTGLPEKR